MYVYTGVTQQIDTPYCSYLLIRYTVVTQRIDTPYCGHLVIR
jgi:hypothetical protein